MTLILRSTMLIALAASVVACRSEESSSPSGSSSSSSSGGGSTGSTTSEGGSAGSGGGTTGSTTTTSSTTTTTSGTGGTGSTTSSTTTSATGGAGGTGTGGSTGTGGTGPCMPSMPTEIVHTGQGSLLLRGVVVTPDVAFQGEVLITGDTITCVDVVCAPGNATIVDTHGVIFPGLIDTHNHIQFDIFDETDWSPMMSYKNHNQWTNEARYGALVDAKQYLNGEGSSPIDYGCEMNKYGELKGIVAGTTSIVGAANPTNRACYGTLARTVDQTPNGGLGADKIQVATLFPATSAADGVCGNFADGSTNAYVIHIAEGVDQTALNEFNTLNTVTTTDGCLYSPKTAIVHGAALGTAQLDIMAMHQMSLVWSPQSNIFLYGAGTDYTKTANIPYAISKGINIALAPDWSIGGSQNLLDELRFADKVDNTTWGDVITPQMLVKMVTSNAAKALGLGAVLGSLAPGMKADVMVVGGDNCNPYEALLAATPADVKLVLVNGVVLYGDAAQKALGPAAPGCEDLDVCGTSKFACVATSGGTATNKFGQTLAEIQSTLSTGIAAYDALNLSAWDFAPITPIVRCPP